MLHQLPQSPQLTLVLYVAEPSRSKQTMEFKDLIVSLPSLNSLEIRNMYYQYSMLPVSLFDFHNFPSVSSLSLQDWPFILDGPKAIQHQIDCAKLDNLSLTSGYVLPYSMIY